MYPYKNKAKKFNPENAEERGGRGHASSPLRPTYQPGKALFKNCPNLDENEEGHQRAKKRVKKRTHGNYGRVVAFYSLF